MTSAHTLGGPAGPVRQLPRLRLLVMLLVGPALIVAAGILWAAGAPDLIVGVLQMLGFVLGGVLTVWAAAVVLRALPVRYSKLAVPGSVVLFIVSAVLHNVWYGIAGTEEPVFFTLALLVAPAILLAALITLPARTNWTRLPSTRPGWVSLAFVGAFVAFMLLFFGGAAAGQRGGDTFFSNPYLAITLLLAGTSGIVAALVAGYAMIARRERSVAAVLTIALGAFVAFFSIAEALGHDEPGGGGPAPSGGANSHSILSATRSGDQEVRVSFDYTYAGDPPDARITTLTVTPLGPDGMPLPGYTPWAMPVSRGSGHVDAVVQFSTGELDRVTGFSVCFAAPEHPNLGCATVNY